MHAMTENVPPPQAKGKASKAPKPKAVTKPLDPTTSHNAQPDRSIEEIYQKKSQLEHILLRPDTYIGSTERQQQVLWVHDGSRVVQKQVEYVPGLYKIFDEILVNAADNKVRDPTMDTLKVDIDPASNTIRVWNNGAGVPVDIHKEEGVYVPELIFGHLLTSSNYDDNEKKITGGRNGYGAKLANIFSTHFVVETADSTRKKRYVQTFKNNMQEKSAPNITASKASDSFTCITFQPDLAKFGMDHLEDDTVALMTKRVYDMAGVLGKGVKVHLNGERIAIKSFQDYVDLYLGPKENGVPRVYERFGERWEICVSPTDGQFQQVSFVNSICTYKGGTHVNHIVDQITKVLVEKANKKSKNANVKPFMVKNHLWVFINSQIENPAFDSQTKENLTLKASSFGTKCELPGPYVDKVAKSGVLDSILSYATFRNDKELQKSDGAKRSRLHGVSKLEDANDAGGKNSHRCTLILTEGDSAKTIAIAGLGVVGRDHYGVFPLRGKLLNVREASAAQISANAEIQNIKQILGLQHGKQYDDVKQLRYGHLMIMADQDHDGSHIKGLIMNFLHTFYPSLLKIPGFLVEFITPIIRATKGAKQVTFYTMPEYETWKEAEANANSWEIKYYKGLGTSRDYEAREYFSQIDRHRKEFVWEGEQDGQSIELAFSKKKVEDRKKWLSSFVPGTFLDQSESEISYSDFINKELILFSRADLERSIPSMVDGLKPGQRKIVFACFKKNLKKDFKVSQLAGYVAANTAYHHGEASLMSTIVNLAQTFVGSNNINILYPSGQFGSRLQGGKDSASPRYIFTRLAPLARRLFHEADDKLLNYLDEEGQCIEPEWYVPILPTVLINGAEGIGTGWSTSIPNYNPRDIVENLKRLIQGQELVPMQPWYRGFTGSIEEVPTKTGGRSYVCNGTIKQLNETTLEVTELPIRKWTQDYKEFLDGLIKPDDKNATPTIVEYREHHSNINVHFIVEVTPQKMIDLVASGLEKEFKLTSKISTGNMMLFDHKGLIKRYETPEQILEEFFHLRIDFYERRRRLLLQMAEAGMRTCDNKVRFILAVVEGRLKVQNRKKAAIEADLDQMGFDRQRPKKQQATLAEADVEEGSEQEPADESASFQYLLSMSIASLTFEKVEQLQAELAKLQAELHRLEQITCKDMWLLDLDNFLETYEAWELEEEEEKNNLNKQQQKNKAQARKPPPKARKKFASLDSDEDTADDMSDDEYVVGKARKKAAPATKAAAPSAKATAPAAKAAAPRSKKAAASAASVQPAKDLTGASLDTAGGAVESAQPAASTDSGAMSLGARLAGRMENLNIQVAGSKPAAPRGGKKAASAAAPPAVDLRAASEDSEAEISSPPVAKRAPAKKAPAARRKPVPSTASEGSESEVDSPAPVKKPQAKKAPAAARRHPAPVAATDDSDADMDVPPVSKKAPAARPKAAATKAMPTAKADTKAAPKRKPRGKVVISSEDESGSESDGDADMFDVDAPSPAVAHQGKVRRTGPSPFHKKKTASKLQLEAVASDEEVVQEAAAPAAAPAAPRVQRARATAKAPAPIELLSSDEDVVSLDDSDSDYDASD